MSLILSRISDSVGTITLNHDQKRNALSHALVTEFCSALDELQQQKARVVVLRAHPSAKVWSAGHDVSELPRSGRDPLAYADSLEQGIRAIRNFPAPIIAMVTGSVWGGACELVLCCDIRVGTPSSTFALTPVKLGVPYNPAGVLRIMNSLAPDIVNEMFFTADPIPGDRACRASILNHVIPADSIESFVYEMATRITRYSPMSISVIKEQLRLLRNARPLTPEAFERIQGLRRKVYDSRDYQEGVTSFLEKRAPVFTGE